MRSLEINVNIVLLRKNILPTIIFNLNNSFKYSVLTLLERVKRRPKVVSALWRTGSLLILFSDVTGCDKVIAIS